MLKKIISISLIFVFAFSLCACSGGISGDEAKSYINGFFEKIENKDYKAAEELLHPERPADLKAFFEALEKDKDVNFENIKIEKYTGFKSSAYDSTVGGAAYSLEMDVSISGKDAELEVEIVRNDNGYGIYNFDIDFD